MYLAYSKQLNQQHNPPTFLGDCEGPEEENDKGFVRIRHFGCLANRRRASTLALGLHSLGSAPLAQPEISAAGPCDLWLCPQCAVPMRVIERFTAAEIQLCSPPVTVAA